MTKFVRENARRRENFERKGFSVGRFGVEDSAGASMELRNNCAHARGMAKPFGD
jgi:hypothetical protein